MEEKSLESGMIWDKGGVVNSAVIEFTAGRDRDLDKLIAAWDITGSMAHAVMLRESGIISDDDCAGLLSALSELLEGAVRGEVEPGSGFEDIHSRVEAELICMTGEAGRRIHAGRSRNDQVLTSISLFLRYEIAHIAAETFSLLMLIAGRAEESREILMPGYTHLQPAMPSSFGLWFGSYAESFSDDLLALSHAFKIINASPAGTAAGYGTSLPLKREIAASLLQFDRMVISSPYAQLRRGKVEKAVADAIASLAFTLSRLAGEVILFLAPEFSFIALDEPLTTGSSIMPQKTNPDLAEVIRARSNVLRALPNTISMMVTNLPQGYNRDYQVLKELLFPALGEIKTLLSATTLMVEGISVRRDIMDERYDDIYSAEAANSLVIKGVPFRDAYRQIGRAKAERKRKVSRPENYSHIGSIGNPGIKEIIDQAISHLEPLKALPPEELAALIIKEKSDK